MSRKLFAIVGLILIGGMVAGVMLLSNPPHDDAAPQRDAATAAPTNLPTDTPTTSPSPTQAATPTASAARLQPTARTLLPTPQALPPVMMLTRSTGCGVRPCDSIEPPVPSD